MADESLKDLKERAKIQSQILETLLAQGKTKSEQDDIKQTKTYRSQLEIYKKLNEEIKNFKNQTDDISNTLNESTELLIDQQYSLKSLSGLQLGFKRDTEKIVKAQTDYLSINSSILDNTEKIQSNITNSLGKYGDITTQLEDANDEEAQRYNQASRILQLQDDLSNATKRQDRDLILSQLQSELVSFGDLIKNSNEYANNLKDIQSGINDISSVQFNPDLTAIQSGINDISSVQFKPDLTLIQSAIDDISSVQFNPDLTLIQSAIDDISSMQAGPAFVDEEVFKLMSEINDMSKQLSELSKEDSVARERMLLNLDDSLSVLKSYGIVSDDILQSLENQKTEAARISNLTGDQKDRLESQIDVYKGIKDSIGGVLNTIGTLFSGIRGFISGTLIGIGTVVNKLGEMNQSLGLSLLDTGEMQLSALGLGLAFKDADAIATGLAESFGSMEKASFGLQLQTNLMATNLGISSEEAIDLTKSFSMLNNSSTDIAADMIKSTQQTAKMAGVVPSKVMKDLAKSTEAFALYGKDGGKNIAEAAVYAAKLGTEMDTLTGITDKLLDFENSITEELELSAMLGRNINLNRARQLAYEGKIEESIGETLNQLGGIEAFNKMDYYQKKQTAELLGVSVGEFQKMAEQQSKMNEDVGFFQEKWSTLTESLTAFGNTFAGTVLQGTGGFLVQLGQINMGLTALGIPLTGIIAKMKLLVATGFRYAMMPFLAIGNWIKERVVVIANMVAKYANIAAVAAWNLISNISNTILNSSIILWTREKLAMGLNTAARFASGSAIVAWNTIKAIGNGIMNLSIFGWIKETAAMGASTIARGLNTAATSAWNIAYGISNTLKSTAIGKWIIEKGLIVANTLAKWLNVGATAATSAANSTLAASQTAIGTTAPAASSGLSLMGKALGQFGRSAALAIPTLLTIGATVLMITPALYILGEVIKSLAEVIGNVLMKALEMLPTIINSIADGFVKIANSVLPIITAIGNIISNVFNGISSVIQTIADSLLKLSTINVTNLAGLAFGIIALGGAIGALGLMLPAIMLGIGSLSILSMVLPTIVGGLTILGAALSTLTSIDGSALLSLGVGILTLGTSVGALGLMLPAIIVGIGGLIMLSAILPSFSQSLLALSSIDGDNLALIGTAIQQIGVGSMTAAMGIMASIGAITVLATILPTLILLGGAFMLFGFGLERSAMASNMLAQSLPIISQSIQQLASSVESIDLLSESIANLASNLSKLSFASILAAPAMIALKLFATPAENVQQTQASQEEVDKSSILEQAIRETNEMLLMEIKGLREDLNSGKIAVNMDGDSVTSKIVKTINRSASNSYGLKGA